MLIPLQMAVSLAIALILDIVITRYARFSRLMIFMPYAIPTVIGALMWGFLYSDNFGPLAEIFESFGRQAPDFLSTSLIFYGLLNIVTWQWAGYYMIVIYAALQGIDPDPLRSGAHRRRVPVADHPADQDPAGHPGAPADPRVRPHRHAAVLQRAEDPAAAGRRRPSRTTSRRTCTPYQQAFSLANYNYGAAISFALGAVVFVCVYIFLFATRKRGSVLS